MTSAINPNNIDGSYPVAGQDNNSQGFRDNFTNIKVNFQDAADEITDLQNKGVFKAALTGTSLDNNMGNVLLYNTRIQGFSATKLSPTGTSGANGTPFSTPPAYGGINFLAYNIGLFAAINTLGIGGNSPGVAGPGALIIQLL